MFLRIGSSKRSDSKERISTVTLRACECEKGRQKYYKAKTVITVVDWMWTLTVFFALHYVIIKAIVYSFIINSPFQHFWGQRTRMRWVYCTSNCVTAVMNKWKIKRSAGMNTIGVSFLDPLDDYEIIHQIGSGTYGDVFKVRMKVRWSFGNCTKSLTSTFQWMLHCKDLKTQTLCILGY